jgi:hypothetical protein
MNEINKGFFEEIKELDEEQNYSSGFNSHRSGDKGINESKYSQMKGSVIDEEDAEEAFSDEDNLDMIDMNEKEKGDFVNLETPMAVGKSRGLLDKDNATQGELESSGDEVGMFEFKALKQSREEAQKKLIVSEAFGDEDMEEHEIQMKTEEELDQEDHFMEDEEMEPEELDLEEEQDQEEEELIGAKPGNEATPNTPLIHKGRHFFKNSMFFLKLKNLIFWMFKIKWFY